MLFKTYQVNFKDAPVSFLEIMTLLVRTDPRKYSIVAGYCFDKTFKKTALIETDDKEMVFHIAQNIDDSWMNRVEVETKFVSEWASLSVGDLVYEVDTKTYWLVLPTGWMDITQEITRYK